MKIAKNWWGVLVAVIVLSTMGMSCNSSDSSESSTSPTILSSNVAGTWLFSGTISSNTCTWLQDNPRYQIGVPGNTSINVTQTGSTLRGTVQGGNIFTINGSLSGTSTGNAFSLTWNTPGTGITGTCSWAFGAGVNVNRTTDNAGTGSVNYTYNPVSGDCSRVAIPCNIVYTGSWVK